jgi:hypothetical protein
LGKKPRDLSQCRRACKKWSNSAAELLYKKVSFAKEQAIKFVAAISKYYSAHSSGNLVKTLTLCEDERHLYQYSNNFYDNFEPLILSLAEVCPNVIEFKSKLNNFDVLTQVYNNGLLEELQHIPFSLQRGLRAVRSFRSYTSAALKPRKSLKSLYLEETPHYSFINLSGYEEEFLNLS